jgi:hypothetical protein
MNHHTLSARRRVGGRSRALASVAALSLMAACDIPTQAPILGSRWVVPSKSTTIAVASLLPTGVSIAPDSSGFTLTAAGGSVTRSLSQDCASCAAANGAIVPKPAFVVNASASTSLPGEIASATLTGGMLQFVVRNNFTFDPLRPSATARGYAVITVSNGATVIGRDSLNGADVALAAGGSLTRSIPLAGTVTGSSPVTVSLKLDSPAGDNVQMDASRTIVITATPTNLKVATAAVSVVNRQISSSSTIDLTDIDNTVSDKVQSGSLLLGITNPFTVGGTLTVSLAAAGGATITKSITLATGTSSPKIDFNKTELAALLGRNVTLTFSGPVNGTAGSVTVSPKQAVVVTSRLDLNLEVGRSTP